MDIDTPNTYSPTVSSEDMLLLLMVLGEREDACGARAADCRNELPAGATYWDKQAASAHDLRERLLSVRRD
jgi:hypothetical protein